MAVNLHDPRNESLDELFRQWMELDNVAEYNGYEDEAANARAAAAWQAYEAARPTRRLVATGNASGVTAVAADWAAEREVLTDYDQTMDAASYRAQ
jgi:hypothetical protein